MLTHGGAIISVKHITRKHSLAGKKKERGGSQLSEENGIDLSEKSLCEMCLVVLIQGCRLNLSNTLKKSESKNKTEVYRALLVFDPWGLLDFCL